MTTLHTLLQRFTYLFAFILCLFAADAYAQLTIICTATPANTPAGDAIYLAGTLNRWAPGAAGYALARTGGTYTITLPDSVRGYVEFKFTRGDLGSVETRAGGSQQPNRTHTIPAAGADTLRVQIAQWADLPVGPGPGSTAGPGVSIMSERFYIPQLGRYRRIWLYLPPDYATSAKRYPVLYMHDGQNLFDVNTAYSGEWGIDEALNAAHAAGDYGCIVVGIENGGGTRLDEYSPWRNAQYGGGQGRAYADFIATTLKHYVDSAYRTNPALAHTGIMGSSMGGLISLYAGLAHPDVFGRVGVFSPSLWFADSVYTLAGATPSAAGHKFYTLMGGNESTTYYYPQDLRRLARTMAGAGWAVSATGQVDTVVKADGQHAEWFWKREFPAAYAWLFGQTAGAKRLHTAPLMAYPNPTAGPLHVADDAAPSAQLQLVDQQGRIVRQEHLKAGKATLHLEALPRGSYTLRNMATGGSVVVVKK